LQATFAISLFSALERHVRFWRFINASIIIIYMKTMNTVFCKQAAKQGTKLNSLITWGWNSHVMEGRAKELIPDLG